jgi:hypothetical protein
MYQLSKTDAVNRLLQGIDGTIVSDITDPLNDTVIQCLRAIDIAVDKIQMENQWNFNMVGPKSLSADDDDEINIPTDYLYIRFKSWTEGFVGNLTVKGAKAYDRKNDTEAVGGTVEIVGSRKWGYDDLSGPMQNLVIEKAKEEYNGLATHLSAPRIAISEKQYREAYQAAQKWDSEQQGGVMDVGPSLRSHLRGANGAWWFGE